MRSESRSKVLIALLIFTIIGSLSALVHAKDADKSHSTYTSFDEDDSSASTTSSTSSDEEGDEEEDDTP